MIVKTVTIIEYTVDESGTEGLKSNLENAKCSHNTSLLSCYESLDSHSIMWDYPLTDRLLILCNAYVMKY